MRKVNNLIFRLILLFSMFACKTDVVKHNKNNHLKFCFVKEYWLTESSLMKSITLDINNYIRDYPDEYRKNHFFWIYPDSDDSTYVMMVDSSFYCSDKYGLSKVFFIDSNLVQIVGPFDMKFFKFRRLITLPPVNNVERKKSDLPFIYDPRTWIYLYKTKENKFVNLY